MEFYKALWLARNSIKVWMVDCLLSAGEMRISIDRNPNFQMLNAIVISIGYFRRLIRKSQQVSASVFQTNSASRKHLRIKVLHLIYSKNGGNLGLVLKRYKVIISPLNHLL